MIEVRELSTKAVDKFSPVRQYGGYAVYLSTIPVDNLSTRSYAVHFGNERYPLEARIYPPPGGVYPYAIHHTFKLWISYPQGLECAWRLTEIISKMI